MSTAGNTYVDVYLVCRSVLLNFSIMSYRIRLIYWVDCVSFVIMVNPDNLIIALSYWLQMGPVKLVSIYLRTRL